jgi:hypothetical protein
MEVTEDPNFCSRIGTGSGDVDRGFEVGNPRGKFHCAFRFFLLATAITVMPQVSIRRA